MRYTVGSLIQYRTHHGSLRDVTVTAIDSDIKNGRPGFDGVTADGQEVWGYDDQITAVRFTRRDLVQG